MKKVCTLILLLLLPLVSAVDIEMNSNFQQGETLLATISGNFLSPLTSENIYFYSDREYLPLTFDIARIQEKYYLYALLPIKEANYTLIIKDAHYFENAKEVKKDIEKNFSVSGNITEFSVYPGFVITTSNFSITFESKNSPLDITTNILNISQIFHLPIGQSKKVKFSVHASNFTLTKLALSSGGKSYQIPVAILSGNKTQYSGDSTLNISEEDKFSFTKSKYNLSVNKNTELSFSLYLKNVGEGNITNISIRLSNNLEDIASISPTKINLEEAQSAELRITIKTITTGVLVGEIKAISGNMITTSDIIINSFSETVSVPKNQSIAPPNTAKPCVFYLGRACNNNEKCNGETISSSDEPRCCTGICEKKTSYSGIIIGVILIILVLAGLFFLYKKNKSKQPNTDRIIEKKSDEFESRFASKEIRGSLSKS